MTYQHITKHTSKNYTPASLVAGVFGQPRRITSITIHHWGLMGQKFENVVNFLCTNNTPTSAHYVVEAGKVATLVAPNDAAWHAGNAAGNATSIGLELRPEATDGDYATAAELIRELRAAYGDLPLVPHKQWFNTACPGKWDLKRLDKLARTGTAAPAASTQPTTAKDELQMASEKEVKKWFREVLKEDKNGDWDYKRKGETQDASGKLHETQMNVRSIKAEVTALKAALVALAADKGVDPAALTATVDKAVKEALAGLEIKLVTEEAK